MAIHVLFRGLPASCVLHVFIEKSVVCQDGLACEPMFSEGFAQRLIHPSGAIHELGTPDMLLKFSKV